MMLAILILLLVLQSAQIVWLVIQSINQRRALERLTRQLDMLCARPPIVTGAGVIVGGGLERLRARLTAREAANT